MSGRAGRRGLDDCGRCIMMVDKEMDPKEAQAMLQGQRGPSDLELQADVLHAAQPAAEDGEQRAGHRVRHLEVLPAVPAGTSGPEDRGGGQGARGGRGRPWGSRKR